LVTFNLQTGAATIIANAAISTFGSGLEFLGGTLFLAGNGSSGVLRTVNTSTGQTTAGPSLTGSPKPGYPIQALVVRSDGTLFAVNKILFPGEAGGPADNLITINPITGVITNLGPSLPRLDGITFVQINLVPV